MQGFCHVAGRTCVISPALIARPSTTSLPISSMAVARPSRNSLFGNATRTRVPIVTQRRSYESLMPAAGLPSAYFQAR